MWTILAILVSGAAGGPPETPSVFSDVTESAGLSGLELSSGSLAKDYILETLGTGVAVFDFDNDGLQDLYFANGSSLEGLPAGKEPRAGLFRNKGDGTFADVTSGSGLDEHLWGFGLAVGDYDGDGLSDLYVTAWGPNRLYRNLGGGRFQETGGLAGVDDPRWGASTAFSDFDGDGLLDLYVANYVKFDETIPRRGDADRPCLHRGELVMCGPTGLEGEVDIHYRNNGDGTFSDVTATTGIRSDIGLYGLGVATADFDNDGDIDIIVANDATPNNLYQNDGTGRFTDIGALSGIAYGSDGIEMGSMGTSFGDFDNDGKLDLLITNFSHQFYQLLHNRGGGYFDDVAHLYGIAESTYLPLGWATFFFDYDNDGFLDILFANGHVYAGAGHAQMGTSYRQPLQLFRNVPAAGAQERRFIELTGDPTLGHPRGCRAGGPFDVDGDGDLDLVLTVIDESPLLLRNESASANHWARFRLVGTTSNRSAIGTRLTATAGGRRMIRYAGGGGSFLWSADQDLHFGLGDAAIIDRLDVVWPDGVEQSFDRLGADRVYLLLEGEEPVPLSGKGAR